MDTSTTIQNNSYHLWTEQQKKERTKNNIHHYGIAKVITSPKVRVIRQFYTGIPDGKTYPENQNGTFLISSRIEKL